MQPKTDMATAMLEAEAVMGGALEELLERSGAGHGVGQGQGKGEGLG